MMEHREAPPWRETLWWGIGLTVVGVVAGVGLYFHGGSSGGVFFSLPHLLASIGQYVAMHLLWRYGTFKDHPLGRMAFAAFVVVLIGAVIKIQHWPYGSSITVAGLCAMLGVYLLHYARKNPKQLSDHLKAAWLTCLFVASIIKFLHLWAYADELQLASVPLFWAALAAFVVEHRQSALRERDIR